EELAQLPMPVERRAIEVQVHPQRLQQCPTRNQVADGADVAVVGAPLHQGDSAAINGISSVALSKVIEHQIGASIRDPFEHRYPLPPNTQFPCRRPHLYLMPSSHVAGARSSVAPGYFSWPRW